MLREVVETGGARERAGAGVLAQQARPPITAESFRLLAARLRRPPAPSPEPASPAAAAATPLPVAAPEPVPEDETMEAPIGLLPSGEDAGETAVALLEMMSSPTGLLPQERALASDTLLLLLPRIPFRQLARLSEWVAIMEAPSPLLAGRLMRDPRVEVMVPLLERGNHIADLDLIAAARCGDTARLMALARRRQLSPQLCGHLVDCGDAAVLAVLLRNPGAELPHPAFARLLSLAVEHPELMAPLVTRTDLPAAFAFELFWDLPSDLRRLVISRFLTDSGTLGRILRITLAEDGRQEGATPRPVAPAAPVDVEEALAIAVARPEEAARRFSLMAGIAEGTARRALSDRGGEPLAVLLKGVGLTRSRYAPTLARFFAEGGGEALIHGAEDLHSVFDSLSFTKARMLLTYWDWSTRRTGPYAPAGWSAPHPAGLVEQGPLA